MNFASSPMNLTVLFFVSMLIWSFFRICGHNGHVHAAGCATSADVWAQSGVGVDLRGSGSLLSGWSRGPQQHHTCRGEGSPPDESRRAAGPAWRSRAMGQHERLPQQQRHLQASGTFNSDKDGQTETFTAAEHHRSRDPNLCLGTVKSARTSFFLLALVFMFMQKSIAAWKTNTTIRASAKTHTFLFKGDSSRRLSPCR